MPSSDLPASWSSWRQRAKLTQAQLAELCAVDVSTIGQIEIGRRRPSVALLSRLCGALGLSSKERDDAISLAAAPSRSLVA